MFTNAKRNQSHHPNPVSRLRARLAAATAVLLGAFGIAAATTPASADMPGAHCLWAGASYGQGASVYAGGLAFTCQTDTFGAPRWIMRSAQGHASTVVSPGSIRNPAGQFSPGARQPGTDYNDYCSGSQLIDGSEDLFEVVSTGGFLMWRSVGPVSQWAFDAESTRPAPTWRSASLCIDGVLS
ncbi:hypothetical protein [Nocardia sp. NPDC046763]|uniref:hypothetical protein n=1 Tax=Nocardia sp. NPDC046763 TaxID=3155256 RepID=UPI0033FFB492